MKGTHFLHAQFICSASFAGYKNGSDRSREVKKSKHMSVRLFSSAKGMGQQSQLALEWKLLGSGFTSTGRKSQSSVGRRESDVIAEFHSHIEIFPNILEFGSMVFFSSRANLHSYKQCMRVLIFHLLYSICFCCCFYFVLLLLLIHYNSHLSKK